SPLGDRRELVVKLLTCASGAAKHSGADCPSLCRLGGPTSLVAVKRLERGERGERGMLPRPGKPGVADQSTHLIGRPSTGSPGAGPTSLMSVSKRAYDHALSGWGEKRVLAVVVDDAGTAGPAGISAGGAVAAPQPPPHGSDGHGGVPSSGAQGSAQESPACRHGERSTLDCTPSAPRRCRGAEGVLCCGRCLAASLARKAGIEFDRG